LLAGVSALAMLACAAEADAETFMFTGGLQSFPVLVSGEYSLDVVGASGGNAGIGSGNGGGVGGLGAEVSGDISLTAGETLTLFVGGRGQNGNPAAGGGGGGFVFLGASVLAVVAAGAGGGRYGRRWSRTGRDRRPSGARRRWRGGRRERERRRGRDL
jgi:hypothetical protein